MELFMQFTNSEKIKKKMKTSLIFLFIALLSVTQVAYAVSIDMEEIQSNISSVKDPLFKGVKVMSYNTSFSVIKSQNGRIETFTIEMPQIANRIKNIQVYLPPDYDSSDKAYPVFYLQAGQFLFNPPPEAVGDYKIDETLDELFFEGETEGVIAVGIELDRDNPWNEYSPWINENMHDWVNPRNHSAVVGGEGFEFIEFIVNTLKPEIDSRYRTLPDRENTVIGGFCRGGLIPILSGLMHPEVFSGVMAMSPTVWLAESGGIWLSDNQLINFINNIDVPKNVKFYFDVGTEEASGPRPPVKDQNGNRITYPQAYIEGVEIVYSTLLSKGVPEENIYFRIIDGVAGGRDEWAKRFDEVVLWLLEDGENQNTPLEPLDEEDDALDAPTIPPSKPTESPEKENDSTNKTGIIIVFILAVPTAILTLRYLFRR